MISDFDAIVAGLGPGGASDVAARAILEELESPIDFRRESNAESR
jgi:hypothetical protein